MKRRELTGGRLIASLFMSTGVLLISVLLMVGSLRPDKSFILLRSIILVASMLLLPLSYVFLLAIVWRGVKADAMNKLEAWWWLSAPYSVVVPLSAEVFHMENAADILMLLAVLAIMTTVSSIVWMLTTVYQLTISKKATLDPKSAAMTAIVLLACVLWAVGYK
jgi:hypothetical protein